MMECLFNPRFSADEVAKEKKLQIAAIDRLKDDPSEYALLQSDVLTFARTAYAHMPMGTRETLPKIGPDNLRKWHRDHMGANNMTWVAVGDFDSRDLKRLLDSRLPPLLPGKPQGLKRVSPPALKTTKFELKTDGRQANLVLGFRAPVFGSKEYFVFRVMNTLLNGMGGRLFVELREKRSLAYSVYAAHDAGLLAGAYQIYIGCAPSKVNEAQRELLGLLSEFSKKKVSAAELQRAKTYMIGLYRMGLQSNRSQVHSYARYEVSGLGASMVEKFPQLIQKITAGDVQKAVKKYLQTDEKTWVLLTPKSNPKEK
jgi:zinc protease